MSTVRIRANNGDVFEIESAWLPMLHQSGPLRLPIHSKPVLDDLVYYVRQCNRIMRLPRRPMQEEGRVVRRRIDVAAVDARATGAIAGRGITAEDQMEAFRRSFVTNRDLTTLVDIGKAAIAHNMEDLADICIDQMLSDYDGLKEDEARKLLYDDDEEDDADE